ncbi:MAG: NAD-dependent epimerase/dehydratase family protein [Lachnospiraceae bacterium]|nr:NAD-dependent epimerase/dehydratase family protein [Lachnospiraceae bacterium]
MNKKVLVLGGTGAMGKYLVPELLTLGYRVDVVSLDEMTSDNPMLGYIKGNTKEEGFLEKLLENRYDGIVDFMTYKTKEFEEKYRLFLDNTKHYIFLSSCRVFADAPPITEESPRLLDVSEDADFLATEDYALYKAKEENLLHASEYTNWTIVRPATTYSTGRFQLVTLEAPTVIYRMQAGKTIVLPEGAMSCQATLSWGGDVGKMIAKLLFNDRAYREAYNVASAEHHSWEEIAAMYNELCPFNYITVSTEDYLDIIEEGADWAKYQLIYARMFQRITDNSKILEHTGMKQEELMSLRDGLRFEYERSKDMDWSYFADDYRNVRMDDYLRKNGKKVFNR